MLKTAGAHLPGRPSQRAQQGSPPRCRVCKVLCVAHAAVLPFLHFLAAEEACHVQHTVLQFLGIENEALSRQKLQLAGGRRRPLFAG